MRNILKSFVTDQNANTGIFMVPMSAVLTMSSLVEEMQVYGNRMENHLGDFKTYEEILKHRDKLKAEYKEVKESKRR